MSERFMRFEYLCLSEEETIQQTEKAYPELTSNFSEILDVLFRLPYCQKEIPKPESNESGFNYWCFERFYRLPYTIRALFQLWIRGYYLESTFLLRHLLEAFVQLRYFSNREEQVRAHLTAKSAKGRTQFVTMFEALAPGSYDRYKTLSNFTHSGLGAGVFSFSFAPPAPGKPPDIEGKLACEFDGSLCSMVMNQLLRIIQAFMLHFPNFFPSYAAFVDDDTKERRNAILRNIEEWKCKAIIAFPKTKELHDLMDSMMK